MNLERHFTSTGFVVDKQSILVLWHDKLRMWLPPGGHIESGEDPEQAIIREVLEETGLVVQVLNVGPELKQNYPVQVSPPLTILIEDIDDPVSGFHKHIDMIYICTLVEPIVGNSPFVQWVHRSDLVNEAPILNQAGLQIPPPEDVCKLGVLAIDLVEENKNN